MKATDVTKLQYMFTHINLPTSNTVIAEAGGHSEQGISFVAWKGLRNYQHRSHKGI
jgi:hypothetical protein